MSNGRKTDRFGHRLTRRKFLAVSGATGFAISTSAIGSRVVAQEGTPLPELKEAPALADQVAAGTLPPVAERLPTNPLVIPTVEQTGVYGGTWRTGLVGGADTAWLSRTIGYDYLVRWSPEWTEVIPNVAESFEVNADATQFTFVLRQGMKWSDGAPFTSADIEFRVNDIYRNTELNSSLGDNPESIEVIDDLTFTITLERPDGLFMQKLATPNEDDWTRYPRHYLEQFHAAYNTTNLDQLVQEAGVADWLELFRTKGSGIPGTPYNALWSNPDLPTIFAHKIVEPLSDATRVTATRNPYYWKIDPEGNQLPYLDGVNYDVAQEAEVLLLKGTSGELDFHVRHFVTSANKSVLAESRESGGYDFVDVIPSSMNTVAIALNLTHKNPAIREVFQNLDFRVGLSHAINRQEIIDTVYVSQGEPWQLAPRRETAFFNEMLAKQYTEFDAALANEHLDRVLPDKGGDGFRLLPDGSAFFFVIEVAAALDPSRIDSMNLIVSYWQAAGVNCSLNPIDRSLLYSRKEANDHDCVIWGGDGGLNDAILEPRWYFPFSTESNFAIPWAYWFTEASNPRATPEEPPEAARQQMDLYNQLEQTPDVDEQNAIFAQLLDIAQQQFWAIGVSLLAPEYGIKKTNFRNVPLEMPGAYLYPTPAPTRPEQYFIEQ